MLNIEYEKQLGKNYMILKGGDCSDSYSIRMVSENKIVNLIPIEVGKVDGDCKYYFEIEGLVQLEKRYAMTSIGYEDIGRLITAILLLPEKLEEYLLNKDHIFLSPATIFVDSDGEPHFVYYPDNTCSYQEGIKEICTYILKKLDHQDDKAIGLGYAVFEISTRENFAISDFQKVLKLENHLDSESDNSVQEEIIDYTDNFDEFDFNGLDFFEEEDFDEEIEETAEEELPKYDEKIEKKELLVGKLIKIAPFALAILIGMFLFLSTSMAALSLPLRIASFLMITIAIFLISYLVKGKFVAAKK